LWNCTPFLSLSVQIVPSGESVQLSGQVRLDLCGGDLAVLDGEAREPAEHEAGDGLTLSERARVRVERIGLLGGDVEDLLLRLRGRGRDEPNNPEHRDEYDEHEQAEPDWPCHGFLLFR